MHSRYPHSRRRAVALLLVLAMLALLGFMVTEYVAAAERRLTWESQRSGQDVLRRNAFSALETTLSVLGTFQRIDGALYGPAQGWEEPLEFAGFVSEDGVEVSVELRDETGYYGINSMSAFQLRRFFQDMGVGESQASEMADSLLDWIDTNTAVRTNGAEEESYANGIAPPNRPIRDLSELQLIKGFSNVFFESEGEGNELWALLRGSVSLFASTGAPNINTAPREVLQLLGTRHGFDPESLLSARSGESSLGGGGVVFRNAGDLGRQSLPVAMGSSVSFTCVKLRVIVRAKKGGAVLVVDTLLDTANGNQARTNQYPFTVLQQRVNSLLN